MKLFFFVQLRIIYNFIYIVHINGRNEELLTDFCINSVSLIECVTGVTALHLWLKHNILIEEWKR